VGACKNPAIDYSTGGGGLVTEDEYFTRNDEEDEEARKRKQPRLPPVKAHLLSHSHDSQVNTIGESLRLKRVISFLISYSRVWLSKTF
jgi:hypothetical protein